MGESRMIILAPPPIYHWGVADNQILDNPYSVRAGVIVRFTYPATGNIWAPQMNQIYLAKQIMWNSSCAQQLINLLLESVS
jgi:hypothetical protein